MAAYHAEQNLQLDAGGDSAGYQGFHALVPILIGLLIPLAALAVLDPRALGNAKLVLNLMLLAIFLVSATIFFASILNPGQTVSMSIDRQSRRMEFVRGGAFANTVYTVSFDRIVAVRMDRTFDDDGYETVRPVVVLRPSEIIELPEGTREADIQSIKTLIGIR